MLTMRVIHKTFAEDARQIISSNPPAIPRVGDKIDMGFAPASKVVEVLWDFGQGVTANTTVTVVVD